MNVNERIRHLRKDILHLTQQDFSNKLHISRSNMGNIEIGRIAVTDRIISSICREFDINEDWIRYGKEPIKKISEGDEYTEVAARIDKNDPKARQAIIEYWKLSDRDKELWWNFVERFFKNDGAE